MKKRILIIAAHPDDELLGCAGTVAKAISDGHEAVSVILGEGMASRGKVAKGVLDSLKKDAIAANKVVGIKTVLFDGLPDNAFDSVSLLEVIKVVEKHISRYQPDIILTHYEHDLNIDHRITFQAVMTACRPQPGFKHPDIYTFEIPSSTDYNFIGSHQVFVPNTYVDISGFIDAKIKALKCYKTEMRAYPHARSLDGIKLLAQYRGVMVGLKYAEAFQLIRAIRSHATKQII